MFGYAPPVLFYPRSSWSNGSDLIFQETFLFYLRTRLSSLPAKKARRFLFQVPLACDATFRRFLLSPLFLFFCPEGLYRGGQRSLVFSFLPLDFFSFPLSMLRRSLVAFIDRNPRSFFSFSAFSLVRKGPDRDFSSRASIFHRSPGSFLVVSRLLFPVGHSRRHFMDD